MTEAQYQITSSPHVKGDESTTRIMLDVLIALAPATLYAAYAFRMPAIINMVVAIVSAVLAEFLFQKIMKKESSIKDLSAVVTGLLLAFNVPPSMPWWMTMVGSVFAIIVVKMLFGGIGHNFMNPALAARAVLLASWPVAMTSFTAPGADAVATATPLTVLKMGAAGNQANMMDLLIGNVSGCIGETSALLLLIGGAYLVFRGVISLRIPLFYIGGTAVFTLIFSGFDFNMMLYNILAGGLILGAFFMATDYPTSPYGKKAQIFYALGCALITSLIRYYGGYAEGVCYSILLMNVAAPLMDKYIKDKKFGEVKKNEK